MKYDQEGKKVKQCTIFGNKDGKDFKIKFNFGNEDYIERLDEELTKGSVMLEDVNRLYIKEVRQ